MGMSSYTHRLYDENSVTSILPKENKKKMIAKQDVSMTYTTA